jgi:hypothetical protein
MQEAAVRIRAEREQLARDRDEAHRKVLYSDASSRGSEVNATQIVGNIAGVPNSGGQPVRGSPVDVNTGIQESTTVLELPIPRSGKNRSVMVVIVLALLAVILVGGYVLHLRHIHAIASVPEQPIFKKPRASYVFGPRFVPSRSLSVGGDLGYSL